MMVYVPPELWIEVINRVGDPSHPRAYCIPPKAKATLLSLSLVNQKFNIWTTPVLYKRIALTSSQIKRFPLALRYTQCGTPSPWPLVEYLSIVDAGSSEDDTDEIIDFLEGLAGSGLKHLYIQKRARCRDIQFGEWWPRPLPSIPGLTERCSWISWTPSTQAPCQPKQLVHFVQPNWLCSIEDELTKIQPGVELTLVAHLQVIASYVSGSQSSVQPWGQLERLGSLTIILWGLGSLDDVDEMDNVIFMHRRSLDALDAMSAVVHPHCLKVGIVDRMGSNIDHDTWMDKGIREGGFWDIEIVEYDKKWRSEAMVSWGLAPLAQ